MRKTGWGAYAALTFAALAATSAQADNTLIMPELLVSAGIEPLPTKEVSSSYTIITAKDIEDHQYKTVSEALQSVPGVHPVQQGGQGALTSLFTRGGNSNHTLVLVNGQPVNDPSSPGNAFDFANLTTENIERVEVVRGPQSALYGSQAMGGVINIITKRGTGSPSSRLRIEAGSNGRFNSAGTTGGSVGDTSYFVSLSRQFTDGTDITPDKYRFGASEERDGYENITGSLRLDQTFNEHLSGALFAQYMDAEADLDSFGEDANYQSKTKQLTINGSLSGAYDNGKWRPALSAAYVRIQRDDTNPPDVYMPTTNLDTDYTGERITASFDNAVDLLEWNTLTFGTRVAREHLKATGFSDYGFGVETQNSDVSENSYALYASEHLHFHDRVFIAGSIRYDMPDNFGNQASFTIASGYYQPETDTRITLSYGTGFKTPSLYQRFGFSPTSAGGGGAFRGNPNLKAETNKGWEVSVEQGFFDSRTMIGATYFVNRVEDPIITDFSSYPDSTTINGTNFTAKGIESYVDAAIFKDVQARLSYTYTVMEPGTTGATSRRPRHKINFSATWNIDDLTTLATDVTYVDLYADVSFAGPIYNPPSYTTVNIAATRKITDAITLTGKVTNLLDRTYYPADGFEAPGIEALAGIAVTF
ncbi:MAG: TonB-dependent receptor [Parvibaculum sp.]|nr:TonB-dependent receptor [Parvibaculum sp.]